MSAAAELGHGHTGAECQLLVGAAPPRHHTGNGFDPVKVREMLVGFARRVNLVEPVHAAVVPLPIAHIVHLDIDKRLAPCQVNLTALPSCCV